MLLWLQNISDLFLLISVSVSQSLLFLLLHLCLSAEETAICSKSTSLCAIKCEDFPPKRGYSFNISHILKMNKSGTKRKTKRCDSKQQIKLVCVDLGCFSVGLYCRWSSVQELLWSYISYLLDSFMLD